MLIFSTSFEPLDLLKEGGYAALALVMFISNFIAIKELKNQTDSLKEQISGFHAEGVKSLEKIATDNASALDKILDKQNELITNVQVQSSNQLNLTHSVNEVVKSLVGIIREA